MISNPVVQPSHSILEHFLIIQKRTSHLLAVTLHPSRSPSPRKPLIYFLSLLDMPSLDILYK